MSFVGINRIKEVGKMQVITSKDNELIKSIKKLKKKIQRCIWQICYRRYQAYW